MLIDLANAVSRLNAWREEKTSLQVYVSIKGVCADLWGAVQEVQGTVAEIRSDSGTLRLELRGGLFHWQDDPPSPSNFAASLLVEFRNGDRFLFSALREIR